MTTSVSALYLSLLLTGLAPAQDSLDVRYVSSWPFGRSKAVAVDSARGLAFLGSGCGVYVVDASVPSSPAELSAVGFNSLVSGLCYVADNLVVADYEGRLRIVSVADPDHPVELGHCDTPGEAHGVVAVGHYAYLADGDAGLRVIAVADPSYPVEVGHFDTPGPASDVAVANAYAYVADGGSGLRVIDVVDLAHPTEVGYCDTPGDACGVAVDGNYAYVADGGAGLRVISVADPTHPTEVGHCDTPGWAYSVAVYGGYAYVADGDSGLWAISIADPANPVETGHCGASYPDNDVAVTGDYAYVANECEGVRIVSVTSHPVEVGRFTPGFVWTDIALDGDYAYLLTSPPRLVIISVADPEHPSEVGSCATPGEGLGLAVVGDYAYVAGGDSGFNIYSIVDPVHPVGVGRLPGEFYDVVVRGQYTYAVGEGFAVIQISQPENPVLVGSCGTAGYSLALRGAYAYVADEVEGRLRVVSIADAAHPAEVGDLSMPPYHWDIAVNGDLAYVAQPSEGLGIVSLADSIHPAVVGRYDTPGSACGVAVGGGGDAYVADGFSGLRVISVRDPHNPVEVGYYDTPGRAMALDVSESGDMVYLLDEDGFQILQFYPEAAEECGDLDVDNDSLDVVADTLRLRGPASPGRLGCPGSTLGEFVLVNTSTSYNPDTSDGPSQSWIDSLSYSASLTGPGGTLDSIVIQNLPAYLAQGQTVICTLVVYLPDSLPTGHYSGPISITGLDSLHHEIAETVYALLNKVPAVAGDLDVDDDSLDVVHDTMVVRAQPGYVPSGTGRFMVVNTTSSYNPDTEDGPSRSPLRAVKVEAKVEAKGGGTDSVYVLNLPESLAVGQAVECTLALVLPAGAKSEDYDGWVVISATDSLGFQVQDSFVVVVKGAEPHQNLDSFRVVPIPFEPNQNPEHDAIHFQGLSAGARVIVYDASGQSVWTATENGDGHIAWKAEVASGIYVYLVVTADGKASKVGKLSVIR